MGKSLGRGHLKRLKGNGEIMLRRVRYEIWDVYVLVLRVVTLLLFLNGYYSRVNSHLHDQIVAYCENRKGVIVAYCENRKGVLQTLSLNFWVCHLIVLIWVPKLGFCPLSGNSQGLLLAVSQDIIPWGDVFIMGLSDSPMCRRCGAEDETSALILCEHEALASHSHVYLSSFFLKLEDIKSISLEAIWNFSKVPGLP